MSLLKTYKNNIKNKIGVDKYMSKMSIRYFFFILILSILIIQSCKTNKDEESKKLKIVTSIEPISDIIKKIGGEKVEVVRLIPPGLCLESYEVKAEDLINLSKSDIYIKLGDSFAFEKILYEKAGISDKVKIFDCTNSVTFIDGNPHIWLSFYNGKILIGNITRYLSKINPQDSAYFNLNGLKMINKLDKLMQSTNNTLIKNNTKIMIDTHPYWLYFTYDLKIKEYSIETEGKETTATNMRKIIEAGKENNVKKVFISPFNIEKTSVIIANELKAELVELNPFPSDYIGNFEDILKKL